MLREANALKRFDKAGIAALDAAFSSGPLADAIDCAPEIPRRRGLSPRQFEQEHRRLQGPVLLEGMVGDWPAIRHWSFRHLAERCGSTVVTVDGYNSEKAREMTFAEFAALLEAAEGKQPASPVYLQEWYYKVAAPTLADDIPELDIAQYDFRRNLYGENISTNHQLWIGQRGGVTIMHQDSYMVDVMHVQIVGEKRWYVMSPAAQLHYRDDGELDFEGLVRDPKTQLMQCTLKPGEVLYLPALWWHRVELLSDSIGLGRKCLDERNLQAHIRLRMAELLSLALNPDEVRETHPELFNVVMKRARTWARRMDIDLSKLRP
jgi:hypothetical protein